jgi:hypothetical protein
MGRLGRHLRRSAVAGGTLLRFGRPPPLRSPGTRSGTQDAQVGRSHAVVELGHLVEHPAEVTPIRSCHRTILPPAVTGRVAATLASVEDPSGADSPVMLLRGGRDFSRRMRLRDPVRPEADELVWFVAEVHDSGLEAQIKVITLGDDDLPGFLRGLADDFRGWPGARHWRSLEDQIRIEAAHDGRGHVTLLFRLRDRAYGDHWDLSVPFTVEAGAEMIALADTVEIFFAAAPLPHNAEH